MKIHNINSPEKEDLIIIYESYLTALIKSSLPNNSVWAAKSKLSKLILTLIAIFDEIKNTFTVIQYRHYTFSPHDLTAWCTNVTRYKSILSSNPSDSENSMLEILCYEACRIFRDKLVNDDDHKKFDIILSKIFQLQWGKTTLINNLNGVYFVPSEQYSSKESVSLTRLNSEDWTNLIKKGITHYGREGHSLNVLVITELKSLTSAISRSLSQLGGCILLAGRSGVGRHSSVRIVSALQSARLITPVAGTNVQFKNDLKMAMQVAGVEGEQVYFLLEDHMIRKTTVLDLVNTFLAAGEIPGLHTTAELDSLGAGLKDEIDRDNYDGNAVQYFIQRVKNNLHMVICLEIDSAEFWRILENCPILYQRCTVIWQSEWCPESMNSVPNSLLQKLMENEEEEILIDKMPLGFYQIHKQVNESLATPRRYVSFINLYINLYSEKKRIILERQTKLQAGITKLSEAEGVVADLKAKAMEQQVILAEKQSKANAALDMISATMQNANIHKQEMELLKEQTEKENEQLIKRKKSIELELAEVEPILQEARSAVGNIKPEALSEIRSLRAPPDVIRDILEGVLRLMGTQDTSWNSMKTFLAKRGVKEDIRSFDASKINPESRQAVERLLQTRSESFDPRAAKRASVAAAPLASWVIANVKYSNVVDKIRPLEREQYKLQQNLQNAKDQIGQLSVGLSDVDEKVAQLKVKLSTYTKEAAEIEINLKAAEDKLHSAEGLVSKLKEEYERWKTQLKELSEDLNQLSFKCILSAAYISYLSGEFENKRKAQIQEWHKILAERDYHFNFEEFLSSDREQLQWQTEGLLADKLSIHNAIVILKSNINVLLLDPSSLALQWLRTHLKHRTIEIITPNAPRFTTSLELAVRFGKILIIEEIDEVPAILFPILKKEFVYQGTRRLILLGNKLIDYHNDFCLYLSSRNINVDIPSDALAVLSLVNFTTTNAGLTEQLFSAAIRQEYPDLESKRNELLQKREELQEQQYNLQNQLLEELANAKGDILQNKQLLTSLNDTKASSIAINSSLIDSTNIEIQLRTECDVLRPLSSFGSLLYFATTDLIRLNVMYTISISSFINLFLKSITTTNNAQEDYSQVQRTLLQSIYSYISRGMFKSDRLLFALYLCKHMFPQKITEHEWDLFVGYGKALPKSDENESNPHPNWIPDQFLHGLSNLQNTLPNVYNSLKLEDSYSWEKFMKQRECEQYFPSNCNLSEFQQVLIVQILRPDRLHSVMKKCALHLTGMKNLSPRSLYLTQLYKETVPNEPVLLITAPGADPSTELRDLAAAFIGIDKYKEVAMGEGQESLALQCLEESAKLGHWLCLKNLHLVTSWSSLLSQKIQTLNPNEKFRLWLVTEPHPLFSSVLIQSCTKLAYEAPPGIKNNLLRTYATWGKDYIQKQNATGARLLFVLAYVHALLQERRTYIPQGWTKWYEFSDVDLHTATKLSEEIWTSKTGSILWNNIQGLCSDAVYGGRIDEQQDERVLLAYLRENFLDSVLSHKWKLAGMNTPFPNNSNYQDYVDCINQLSDNDTLSYFGLPANIDRALEKNSSTKIISNLKVISLPVKPSTKIEKEDWHRGLSHLLIFWKKLNKGQDWLRITVTKLLNGNTVLETYIAEEKCFSIELIQKIHTTLSTINKIARGTALSTEKDAEIANSLLAYQTPYEWQSYWKGPNEPFKYLQTVVDKATNISKWNSKNANDILLNSPVDLSSMFRPKMFFAALKQHICRLTKIPIDDLHLKNSWGKPLKSNVNVTLTGIFIEGAQFDGQNLSASSSDVESVTNTPMCCISWVPKMDFDHNENYFEVPLYSSSRREEQLTTLLLPSEKSNHDQWLLAGISLFLEY